MIELVSLGGSSILHDGADFSDLSAHKQKVALLSYLAVEGPVARDGLLTLFWPERREEKARHSLSQALYALKKEPGQECVTVSGDRIGLLLDAVSVDVKELEAALKRLSDGDFPLDKPTGVHMQLVAREVLGHE